MGVSDIDQCLFVLFICLTVLKSLLCIVIRKIRLFQHIGIKYLTCQDSSLHIHALPRSEMSRNIHLQSSAFGIQIPTIPIKSKFRNSSLKNSGFGMRSGSRMPTSVHLKRTTQGFSNFVTSINACLCSWCISGMRAIRCSPIYIYFNLQLNGRSIVQNIVFFS